MARIKMGRLKENTDELPTQEALFYLLLINSFTESWASG